jgi:SAM-dependent methyltransferase
MESRNLSAINYTASKDLLFRYHIEMYTFFNYVVQNNPFCDFFNDGSTNLNLDGSNLLTDKTVLDLACGSGVYTKILKTKFNAKRVIGVDISAEMIKKAQEINSTPGVEYVLSDAADVTLNEEFDLVVASFLLCNAKSPQELLRMLSNIYKHLKPGGRFVTITDNFNDDPKKYGSTAKYGFIKIFEGKQEHFDSVLWQVTVPGCEYTLRNYRYGESLEWAMEQAGFGDWHLCDVHSTGDKGFWKEWDENKGYICIEAIK